ncbi:MAG: adenylate kinase [Candidatus Schekmanbacteria bacterium]|nr:adenylate kinase [Candidatus Schekmanbacteria bacterium]
MRLIFLGAPGAGKGTQAQRVSAKYSLPQVSTGDILRDAVKSNTELGKKAQGFIQKGFLVSDEIILGIVKERLAKDDCQKGYILDGFPRTIIQAQAFNGNLSQSRAKIDYVLNIEVPEDKILERLSGRRVCTKCGEGYHLIFKNPLKENICDKCGSGLYQRKDDQKETIIERLRQYREQTLPLIDYYKKQNVLRTINGDEQIDLISKKIDDLLSGLRA